MQKKNSKKIFGGNKMKYCMKCGKELVDEAVICTGCGCSVDIPKNHATDEISGGLMTLSILLPIVGIILWPVKHKQTPKAAMTYGVTGIISWIVWYIVFMLLLAGGSL